MSQNTPIQVVSANFRPSKKQANKNAYRPKFKITSLFAVDLKNWHKILVFLICFFVLKGKY